MSLVQDPGSITAIQAAFARGESDPVDLMQTLLARVDAVDAEIQAWVALDRTDALQQARQRALELRQGDTRGPLHGIPVAIKDVIDVAGVPTIAGSRSRAHWQPAHNDADIVAALRAAGAVIMGKVHTTEFAYFDGVPPTRNPWHTGHTPGGSSGGSAAVVAAGMAVCSIGTQTAGSVVRPAAYCGVAAFKPTTQNGSTYGVVPFAPSFDTVGWFAHRFADVAAMSRALHGLRFIDAPAKGVLNILVLDDPFFGDAAADMSAEVQNVADRITTAGHRLERAPAPVPLAGVLDDHFLVLEYEIGHVHRTLAGLPDGDITPALIAAIQRGLQTTQQAYAQARSRILQAQIACWNAWQAYDAVILPAAPSSAPAGKPTGDPRYIIPFTALGGPIATLPTGLDRNGMPLGMMVAGRPGADARLLECSLLLAEIIELPRTLPVQG